MFALLIQSVAESTAWQGIELYILFVDIQMENEVRRLALLVEQNEQQMAALASDHSRRLQEERVKMEAK